MCIESESIVVRKAQVPERKVRSKADPCCKGAALFLLTLVLTRGYIGVYLCTGEESFFFKKRFIIIRAGIIYIPRRVITLLWIFILDEVCLGREFLNLIFFFSIYT